MRKFHPIKHIWSYSQGKWFLNWSILPYSPPIFISLDWIINNVVSLIFHWQDNLTFPCFCDGANGPPSSLYHLYFTVVMVTDILFSCNSFSKTKRRHLLPHRTAPNDVFKYCNSTNQIKNCSDWTIHDSKAKLKNEVITIVWSARLLASLHYQWAKQFRRSQWHALTTCAR